MIKGRRWVYRGRHSGSVPRPAISEERFTQLAVLGLGGGFFLLGVRTVEDERAARIHFEANVAQLCFFDCAVRRQAFSGWDNVIAAVFSRLLLAESAYAFRRLIPEILQAIEHPRLVFVEEFGVRCPAAFFGQPGLAAFGVLLAGSGVEMGRLDATTPVAQMEDQLALRNRPAAHLVGDAVGFAGSSTLPEGAVARRQPALHLRGQVIVNLLRLPAPVHQPETVHQRPIHHNAPAPPRAHYPSSARNADPAALPCATPSRANPSSAAQYSLIGFCVGLR